MNLIISHPQDVEVVVLRGSRYGIRSGFSFLCGPPLILHVSVKFKSDDYNEIVMNVMFICNQNQHRSRTAEDTFRDRFNTRSAGLFNQEPLTEEELSWADVVYVMEEYQRGEIAKRFPKLYMQKRIVSLDIPDIFRYKQPELVNLLKKRIEV